MNKKCQLLNVSGAHCAACKILIEKEISKIDGVKHVSVSVNKGKVIVETKDNKKILLGELNDKFKQLGYQFSESSESDEKGSLFDWIKLHFIPILLAIGVVVFFYSSQNSSKFGASNLTEASTITGYFFFGLAAGLSTCSALVGGLLVSATKAWTESYGKSYKPHFLFLSGRVFTFFILGGLLGLLGGLITISARATAVISLVVSLIMIYLGLQMLGFKGASKFLSIPRLSNILNRLEARQSKIIPFILGALTFFVPCAFTLIAQTNALAVGNFRRSAILLLSFAVGTIPPLLVLSFAATKMLTNSKLSRQFSVFMATLILLIGLYSFNSQLNALGIFSLNDISRAVSKLTSSSKERLPELTGATQLMQMEAKGFEYVPREIALKVGVPVRWEIFNSGAVGCATAVFAPGLYNDTILLNKGLNVVNFTPEKRGTYKISCSMGMVPPVFVTVQ